MTPGHSWAHPLFHFWEQVSPFYLGDTDALCFICESLIFRIESKTNSYHDNLQDKLLVPLSLFFFFFLLLLISVGKHWPADPQGWVTWGSSHGSTLGLLLIYPTPVSAGEQGRVGWISLRGKHFFPHWGWLTTEANRKTLCILRNQGFVFPLWKPINY